MSKARQMSLEQKIVSFEQKKAVLDRIVQETNVSNIGEFIQRYNDQERVKAEAFARIEAKSGTSEACSLYPTIEVLLLYIQLMINPSVNGRRGGPRFHRAVGGRHYAS